LRRIGDRWRRRFTAYKSKGGKREEPTSGQRQTWWMEEDREVEIVPGKQGKGCVGGPFDGEGCQKGEGGG